MSLLAISFLLLPPADYLPGGNRNTIQWRVEPLPGTSISEAIGQSKPVREFVRAQPEVDRVMFIDRPGALRAISAILKPEFATTRGLAEIVINHTDLERSITLTASLTDTASLGAIVEKVNQEILTLARTNLPAGYRIELAGTADQLARTVSQLTSAFAFAILITYLLLVALYRSFLYPIVIMATIPMGMSGALLSLVLINRIPGMSVPLDMITALGFVILTGIVVNNAILLVDRALQLQQEGEDYDASLFRATQDRLRAIFMSAGTSVLGMLPLAVLPGQGSELYQGLGIVLTGGLTFSTILTPTVVPALMGLLRDFFRQKPIALPVEPSTNGEFWHRHGNKLRLLICTSDQHKPCPVSRIRILLHRAEH